MKAKKGTIVFFMLIALVFAWPMTFPGQTSKAMAAAEPTYTVLNPEAPLPQIDVKPLSPRLSSFAGKTIIIYDDHGGYEKPMAGLADQLKPLLPADTKIVYYEQKSGFKVNQMKGDAAIVGHGY